jgi:hypothetical protein
VGVDEMPPSIAAGQISKYTGVLASKEKSFDVLPAAFASR